jgi:hypothetical protein
MLRADVRPWVHPNDGREYMGFRVATVPDLVGMLGDFNGDGAVNASDYTVWRDGNSPDSSQNGYEVWASNYGTNPTLSPIPEPTSLALAAMLAGCGMMGRRSV